MRHSPPCAVRRDRPARPLVRSLISSLACAGLALTALGPAPVAAAVTTRTGASVPAAHLEAAAITLEDPVKKEIAMRLVSSAENSTLDWEAQYGYIEDIGDGRGYTAGIIGFCSGTGDMLDLVELYTARAPRNVLAGYLPALRAVDGTDSHEGLDPGFTGDWAEAATDPVFRRAQDDERDRVYFGPAVRQAVNDGLGVLGQFIYYDALVMHGGGSDPTSFGAIRRTALEHARSPSRGGGETAYLDAFLDARVWAMRQEEAHSDTSRVDTAQRVFLREGNLDLDPPLVWQVYGDSYRIG
ncbi:chitosanase [Streptomyces nitrosporeus]|uniref:Chitosanase n=1 Tax=Streptomyces nitrosporeus TaxID=28894 RepID=A0A5J6F5I7_9ACTN|nr:chitosanase [Streptomyces nitrosporeus]QEU71382.1 chitosanase [Streptomyces nitrosporeus]GGY98314.1 chitosanase [Streptomyces nitrosporeus]